jgi:hypothetical protein
LDQIKPPTDSLYKFIAIFGLVLYLGSHYAAYKVIDIHWQRTGSYFDNIDDKDGAKYERLKLAIENQESDDLDPFIRGLPSDERVPFVMLYRSTKDLSHQFRDIYIARIVGIIMVLVGFAFWYIRIQRYVDTRLRRDAEKP